MSGRWHKKLLLSYLPIFFGIVLLLMLIFFLAVGDLSRKQARQANDVFTRHVAQSMDYSLRSIDQALIKEIQGNETFRRFFFREDNPYLAAYDLSEKLRNLAVNTRHIDSIYAFRLSDRMVLGTNTMVPLEQFGDREFIESVIGGGVPGRWTDSRPFSELPGREQSRHVVSLVKKMPILSGTEGFVVVNVRVGTLKALIDEMSGIGISYVNVFSPQGNFVTGSSGGDGQEQIAGKPASGIELSQLDSDYTGWSIRSGLQNPTAYELFSAFSIEWLLLGAIVVLLGAAVIFYMTGRHYRPVQSVLQRIHRYSGHKNGPNPRTIIGDEFAFIEKSFDNLMEQAHTYEKRHEEDQLFRRKHLFFELLEGIRIFSQEEWKEEASRLQLPAGQDEWVVAVAEMDRYADFCRRYSERDQELLKHVLKSVLYETAQTVNLPIWGEWLANDRLGLLLGSSKETWDEDGLDRYLGQVKAWLTDHLTFTVTFGIGVPAGRIADISQSYAEAQEALSYKTALGCNRVIRCGKHVQGRGASGFEHLHHIHRMSHEYRIGHEQWRTSFETTFRLLQSSVVPRDDIVHLSHYFVYTFSQEIGRLPEPFQEIWNRDMLPKLTEAVGNSETLEEMELRLREILEDGVRQMDTLRETKSNHAVSREVRRYIEERYDDPELSLDHLSGVFGLTGSYLSRLFREEFGERFVDYLLHVRIERAKELLKETQLPIQEIGRRVGYTHAISFSRMFKKIVGMTPGEYRNE